MQNIHRVHCTAERPDDDSFESVVGARAVLSVFFEGKHVAAAVSAVKCSRPQEIKF